jgi:signal transduction histidine kinase
MHELDKISAVKFLSDLSCVTYECTPSFEVAFLSENIFELLGIPGKSFIGNRSLWEQSVAPEDQSSLRDQMTGLKQERSGSLMHRFMDIDGLPLWVCNRMHLVRHNEVETVRGCLIPLGRDRKLYGLDPAVGSQFAHKLANQFQILGMILSSVRRSLPHSKDIESLQQTLDRAVEFARAFSQYNQFPARVDGLRVSDIIDAVLASQKAAFRQKGIVVREELDPVLKEMVICGDAFFLDLAFRHVLQNALEAAEKNGEVAIEGNVKSKGRRPIVMLRIADSGRGMKEAELTKAGALYFSTKKNHEGVGLSLAQRFVELQDGSLRVSSAPGQGTQVEIILPARRSVATTTKDPCR